MKGKFSDSEIISICNQTKGKKSAINNCLSKRKDVTDKCFGGVTDESHEKEETDLGKSLSNLDDIEKLANCNKKGS